jgi:hypothetical protein
MFILIWPLYLVQRVSKRYRKYVCTQFYLQLKKLMYRKSSFLQKSTTLKYLREIIFTIPLGSAKKPADLALETFWNYSICKNTSVLI